MRAGPRFSLILLAGLIWLCCWSIQAQTRATCGCAFVGNQQPKNVGVVFAGRTQAEAVKPNMVVHTGDVLKVRRPVSATLICDNVKTPASLKNTPRNQPVPCRGQPEEGILIGRNGRKIEGAVMGDTLARGFPVVLSPRSTKILGSRPMLRWTSIPNANMYRITVRGNEKSWSAIVPAKPGVQIQEVIYPPPCGVASNAKCAPALTSRQSYKLIVEANNRSSEEEDLPNLGFSMLALKQILSLKQAASVVNRLAIGAPLKTKMRASLYANNGLAADAIRLLESDANSQENPEAVRLMGDLYFRIGLLREAENWYLKLLESRVRASDTTMGQAITNQTLAEIYEKLGNRNEAVRYYVEAEHLYQVLDDQDAMSRMNKRLADLGRP